MHCKFLLLFFLFGLTPVFAQNANHCGLDTYRDHQIKAHPEFLELSKRIELHTQDFVERQKKEPKKAAEIVTIPVVVHVVHTKDNPATNVSAEKIKSQIEALNRDFRRLNEDTANILEEFKHLAADIEVEFCLATRDPNGFPTTGITRTETEKDRFFVETNDVKSDEAGGKDPWPYEDYLNIWVCGNLCSTFAGCGILGYGTPPFLSTPETDGIAVQYNFFGMTQPVNAAYNQGRTAVHEVGHWLNLRHTWGNGSDNSDCNGDDAVEDTPRLDGPTYGCSPNRRNSCVDEGEVDPFDMAENYMDYRNDACLNLFTEGQKMRMRAVFDEGGFRESILSSMGCMSVEQGIDDIRIIATSTPNNIDDVCAIFYPTFSVENFGTKPLVSFDIDYSLDGIAYNFAWEGLIESLKSSTITLPLLQIQNESVEHELIINVSNPNGQEDFNSENNELIVQFESVPPSNKGLDFSEDFQIPFGFPFPPIGWKVVNIDNDFDHRFQKNTEAGYGDLESAYVPNFDVDASYIGEIDELISPSINLTSVFDSLYLQFFYAYTSKGEGTISDTLEVLLSIDCGETFFSLRKIFGGELITTDPTIEAFVPMEGQWKEVQVSLLPYQSFTNVSLKIRQIRGSGNSLYIDHINLLSGLTDIETIIPKEPKMTLTAYPNPVRKQTIIELSELPINQNLQLSISNKAGQVVYQKSFETNTSQQIIELPVEDFSHGMYIVSLQTNNQSVHTKLLIAN